MQIPSLPYTDPELIGLTSASQHFKDNYAQYESEVRAALATVGYQEDWWPEDPFAARQTVYGIKRHNKLPTTVVTAIDITRNTYEGPKQSKIVEEDFSRRFTAMPKAMYVITEGQDWWPYEHAFLAHDAASFMQYFLYVRACSDQSVLPGNGPKRGRPRNEGAHLLKSERKARYTQWLADCAAYRERLELLKANYETALAELSDCKAQGAPKWNP